MSQPPRSLGQSLRDDAQQSPVWPAGSRLWVFNPKAAGQANAWTKLKVESFNAGSGLYLATDVASEETTYTLHTSIHFLHWVRAWLQRDTRLPSHWRNIAPSVLSFFLPPMQGDAQPPDIQLLPAEQLTAGQQGTLPLQGNLTHGMPPHPTVSSSGPGQAPFAHHPSMSGMHGGIGPHHSAFTVTQFGGPQPMPPNYAPSHFMQPPMMCGPSMMPGYGPVPVPGPADSGMPFMWNPAGVGYAAAFGPQRPTSPVGSVTQSHAGAAPFPHHPPMQQQQQWQQHQGFPMPSSPSPSASAEADGSSPEESDNPTSHQRGSELDTSLTSALDRPPGGSAPSPAAAAAVVPLLPYPVVAAEASATPPPSPGGGGRGAGDIDGEAGEGSGLCRDHTPVSVWVPPVPDQYPATSGPAAGTATAAAGTATAAGLVEPAAVGFPVAEAVSVAPRTVVAADEQQLGARGAEELEVQGMEDLEVQGADLEVHLQGAEELEAWPQLPDPEGLGEGMLGYHLCNAFMNVRRRLGLGYVVGGAITTSLLHCSHALRLEYFRELRARIGDGRRHQPGWMGEEEQRERAVATVVQAVVWRCGVAEAEAEMMQSAAGPGTPSAGSAPLIARDSSALASAV